MKTDKERKELIDYIRFLQREYTTNNINFDELREMSMIDLKTYEQPYLYRIKELEGALAKFTILNEGHYKYIAGLILNAKEKLK